jgi:hypothetical protein
VGAAGFVVYGSPNIGGWPIAPTSGAGQDARHRASHRLRDFLHIVGRECRDHEHHSLRAMEGRKSNTAALLGLIGRGGLGWDGLLAEARYGEAQVRLPRSDGGLA